MATFPHQRFERMIKVVGKCWAWMGSKSRAGYGYFTTGSRRDGTRKKTAAHVFSYKFYEGPVAPGQVVYRACETDGCVNPDHLRAGTRRDMIRLAIKKGRWHQGNPKNFPQAQCGQKNPNAKLTDVQANQIRAAKGIVKAIVLARRYPVSEGTIYQIWEGKSRKEETKWKSSLM